MPRDNHIKLVRVMPRNTRKAAHSVSLSLSLFLSLSLSFLVVAPLPTAHIVQTYPIKLEVPNEGPGKIIHERENIVFSELRNPLVHIDSVLSHLPDQGLIAGLFPRQDTPFAFGASAAPRK